MTKTGGSQSDILLGEERRNNGHALNAGMSQF